MTMNALRIATVLFACLLLPSLAGGGQKVFLGVKAPASLVSIDSIDHSLFSQILKKHVDIDGLVDYRGLKNSPQKLAQLDRYLALLSTADLRASAEREAKFAYWINAYNAVTLKGMLREYPTTSIKNHTAKLYGYHIWKDLQLYVGGTPVSLDQMEHDLLRKMSEPRIHFAVVCASKGCPRLLNEAYVAERVLQQLEINAKDFFSRPQNFRFEANRIYLSSILKWYGDDFGANQASQLKTYAKWLPTPSAREAATAGRVRISFLPYDWSINEQPQKRAQTGSSRTRR